MVTLNHATIDAAMHRAQAAAPGSTERAAAIRTVVDHLLRQGALAAWTTMPSGSGEFWWRAFPHDDRIQEAAAIVLQRLTSGTIPEQVSSWPGWLYLKVRQAMRDAAQSGAVTVAAGMSTVLRRHAMIQRATEQVAAGLDRAPTPEEIVAAANAGRNEHAARSQGTWVTVADVVRGRGALVAQSLDDTATGAYRDPSLAAPSPETLVADADAVRHIAEQVLAAAAAHLGASGRANYTDPLQVGAAWVVAAAYGQDAPTVQWAVDEFGWGRARAQAAVREWTALLAAVTEEGRLDGLRPR